MARKPTYLWRTFPSEYASWSAMKERCTRAYRHDFKHYGGRGITFDPLWATFAGFFSDMGAKPEGYTLDRINRDGNYCKANCRWASWSEQQNNRRNNTRITLEGQSYTVAQAARATGVPRSTFHRWLKRGIDPAVQLVSPDYLVRRARQVA
jgi:hypothetical protein